MSRIDNKARIKNAKIKSSHFDLSCQHITTANFMRPQPVYYRHVIPGQSLSIDANVMARLAPMPVPTYGRVAMHLNAFFVPYRQVFKGWNDFIEDTTRSFSSNQLVALVSHVPTVSMQQLRNVFIASGGTYGVVSSTKPSTYDFEFVSAVDGNLRYVTLNADGRFAYKLLCSLGYRVSFPYDANIANTVMSALPILAMARIYIDYYYPAQYVGALNSDIEAVRLILERDYSATPSVDYADVRAIINIIKYVNYDSDYFTSAFDEPTGIGGYGNVSSPATFMDINQPNVSEANKVINSGTNPADAGLNADPGTPVGELRVDVERPIISQYFLNTLKAFTLYAKRNRLVGSRALERYMARFGIVLDSEVKRTPFHLGTKVIDLMVRDVNATNETDTATLGSYAGIGYMQGTSSFNLQAQDEYGIVIIVASIVPRIMYAQGIDRNLFNLNKLDFFTPEFDALDTQPIRKCELFAGDTAKVSEIGDTRDYAKLSDGVFGFTPRYSEYKVAHDLVTGDFLLPSKASGMSSDSWHLARLINPVGAGDFIDYDSLQHSPSFVVGSDSSQYNRMFYNTQDTADKFALHFWFQVDSTAPMCSLYDDYDMLHNDEHNADSTVYVNGVRVN